MMTKKACGRRRALTRLGARMGALAAMASIAPTAYAETIIVDDLETPIATATIAGGAPDDIRIDEDGSVEVESGAAVTMNSDNNIVNEGAIGATAQSGATGIAADSAFSGDITNAGAIGYSDDYTIEDIDDDGDLDGAWAQGSDRAGIRVTGAGVFVGDIENTEDGSISVDGDDSYGVIVSPRLGGSLINEGAIAVTGDDSIGIYLAGGATGDVTLGGSIRAAGEGAQAVVLGGAVDGAVTISGSLQAYGYHSLTHTDDDETLADLDSDDLLQGGSALTIRGDVAGGVLIVGVGVEDDVDDDGDGITEDEDDDDDDTSGSITSYGEAPALHIGGQSGAQAILIGAGASGFSLLNRGSVTAGGVYDGIAATALRIDGGASGATQLSGGVRNDGAIQATAYEASSTAILIGRGADVARFSNRNAIRATTISETDANAYGVRVEAGASLGALTNTAGLEAIVRGETGDAYAILDESGTLTSITNSSRINAAINVTDDDDDDGITPVATGAAIAIDVSANNSGVSIRQRADTVFTDDDSEDDDEDDRYAVEIIGDIRLGSGGDLLDIRAGAVRGDVSFGLGADMLFIGGGASVTGALSDSDGALSIDVRSGALTITEGDVAMTDLSVGSGGTLTLTLSEDAGESTFLTTMSAQFDSGARLVPLIPEGLPQDGAIAFLDADTIAGAENVAGVVTGEGVPWLYNVEVRQDEADPTRLEAAYTIKTAEELGLNRNQTAAYDEVVAALRRDDVVAEAFSTLDTEADFFQAYGDLLPNYAPVGVEMIRTALMEVDRASSNRLADARLRDFQHATIWLQEIGFVQERETETGAPFDSSGFGFAAGIDGPLESGQIFGLTASFVAGDADQAERTDSTISAALGQVGAYIGASAGPFDLDASGGLGLAHMSASREVAFGGFEARTEADWLAYAAHATLRVSAPRALASFLIVKPYGELAYVLLSEEGYEESGGGAAIDLAVEGAVSQRLSGEVGLEIAAPFAFTSAQIAPRLTLGWREDLIEESAERDVRFVSGANTFLLIDEPLGGGGAVLGFAVTGAGANTALTLAYEGVFGDTLESHSLNASVRFRF